MSKKRVSTILHGSLLAIVLVSLLACVAPSSTIRDDTIVNFPDPNLQAAIRQAIGKPTGDIYQSDLGNLTSLATFNRNISDLSGLEYCTSLTTLSLYYSQVSNISPLSGLNNLTSLDLYGDQISDISPLSGLTSLTELHLSLNKISDISPLSGLTNLTRPVSLHQTR